MGVFALLLVICLLAAVGYYGKPWFDRRLLHRVPHPKKTEEEDDSVRGGNSVEIVVSEPTGAREADERQPPVPVASAVPARLARQQLGSPLGPMEASIRTALRELRSRQVVKSICSKFEARMATAKAGLAAGEQAATDSLDDDRSVRAVQYQSLVPLQTAIKEVERPQPSTNFPAPRHSVGGVGAALPQRSNNLNAFLRRYSSNLEKAVMAMQTTISSESNASQDVKVTDGTEETEARAIAPAAISASSSAQPVLMTPCDGDSDLEDDYDELKLEETLNREAESASQLSTPLLNLRLDIEPIVAIPENDFSNQCDSHDDNDSDNREACDDKQGPTDPLESTKGSDNNDHRSSSPRSRLAKWTASRIPTPAARSLSRSALLAISGTQKELQTPERASKSVARLQQFRQQVPANAYNHLD